ncbi:MAG TPA: family 20 glycosylhydrolase [Terracidiphilus sp.]
MRTLVPFRSVLFFFVSATLALSPASFAQQQGSLALMPLPAHVTEGEGQFLIDGSFAVAIDGYTDARVVAGKRRFLDTLNRETGIPFAAEPPATNASFIIKTAGPSDAVEKLGEDESYHLVVSTTKVELSAPNSLGILHGLQTFLQLVHITPQGFSAPVVTIDDQPRFAWRGIMFDVGRHFMPLPVIERNLDGMEAVKLNVMHWHLSDDQGFRVESRQFPLLQQKGSNGSYYTQAQVHEVIDYARARGIRVVPEFDMPCHTTSWFAGYPQLASGSGPYQIATKWGILDAAMDPTRETTYEFLDKFLGEMTALFPDAYFHIGGDECDGKEWDANPRIQAFMRAHNLKDNAALQSYFTGRVQKLVAGHHKIMEGWDEVLQPDTPRDVVIQSWRGPTALAIAARQGNRVLLSHGYYIDLNQPASEHYLVDPLGGDGASLNAEQKARVLGGEATMWSEFVTPENIDSRIWPRTAAIAERFWSPQDVRDVDSMYRRMAVVSQKLDNYSLEHNSFTLAMLERMSGNSNPEALEVLAAVVQPPMGYKREQLKQYNTQSPLNRLVDAVPPESETARQFNQLATLIVAGNASPEQWQEAKNWLVLWRDNDAKLAPTLANSDLTAELAPLSQSLSQVATLGLQVLDDLKNHRSVSADQTEKNLQLLKDAAKPQAVLLDKVAPSVELLVAASGKQ